MLHPRNMWFSFRTQAIMSVRYGLVPLMLQHQDIDKATSSWYYHCLPAPGVNRNIAKEWRTLPVEYQGLGLPNLSLEKLADSLRLLQRHWGSNTDVGWALRNLFELIQIETGLQGNFLVQDFNALGGLASHSWFKGLWELISYYQVNLVMTEGIIIPPLWERDMVIMEAAIKILPADHWVSFNRALKHFKVYFMLQLVLSDGCTVDPTVDIPYSKRNSSIRFPIEHPTSSDLEIWRTTIRTLTSPSLTLSPRP